MGLDLLHFAYNAFDLRILYIHAYGCLERIWQFGVLGMQFRTQSRSAHHTKPTVLNRTNLVRFDSSLV